MTAERPPCTDSTGPPVPAPRRQQRPSARRTARLAAELALIAAGYLCYTLLRNAVPTHEPTARLRAGELLRWESAAHLDPERTLNTALAGLRPLAVAADYYYATAHFLVVIAVALWAARRAPGAARRLRAVFYTLNALGLAGFWLFPLAPPRLLTGYGFIDTVVAFHTWGSWGSTSVDAASNQFAAMPSLHVGWALWCTLSVWTLTRQRLARLLAAGYPVLTALVVLGTANHYLLDVAGGALALLLALAATAVLPRRRRSAAGARDTSRWLPRGAAGPAD